MSRSQEIISRRDEFKKRTKEMLNYTPLYIAVQKENEARISPNLTKEESKHSDMNKREVSSSSKTPRGFMEKSAERKELEKSLLSQYGGKDYSQMKFQLELRERELQLREEKQIQESRVRLLADKSNKFSKVVQMTFKPKVSEKKRREVQLRILMQAANRRRLKRESQGLENDEVRVNSTSPLSPHKSAVTLNKSSRYNLKIKNSKKSKERDLTTIKRKFDSSEVSKLNKIKVDYLRESRLQKEANNLNRHKRRSLIDKWNAYCGRTPEQILHSRLSTGERREDFDIEKEKVKWMEEETKREEERLKHCGGNNSYRIDKIDLF